MIQPIHITAVKSERRRSFSKAIVWDRRWLLDVLLTVQNLLDHSGGFALVLLLAFLSVWAFTASRAKPLWFDELLGLSIANAPSASGVVSQLRAGVDNSAPLYHLLDHFVVHLWGSSALTARLPAFLGYCALLITLYFLVSRRLSPIYGFIAALLALSTEARLYAWEGRPYGLVLGLAGTALLMYQLITERRNITALITYAISCGALVATHYIALLVVGAFLSGELVRFFENKRVDWSVLMATIIPPLAVLIFLRSLIHAQLVNMESRPQTSLLAFTATYDRYKFDSWAMCIAIGLIALGVWIQANSKEIAPRVKPRFGNHELAVAATLLLLPIIGAVVSHYITRAYIPRYFISEIIGLTILFCYIAAAMSNRCAVIALMIVLAAGGLVLRVGTDAILQAPRASVLAGAKWSGTNAPILFENPHDFLQAFSFYPAQRSRFWYAAEPSVALKIRGYAGDDINIQMLSLAATEPMQVTTLENVIRATHGFVLYPSEVPSMGWVSKCLLASGADMKLMRPEDGSGYVFEVSPLADVTLRSDVCQGIH